jgi:DNA polymerase/3'-5' exonuclease PolX
MKFLKKEVEFKLIELQEKYLQWVGHVERTKDTEKDLELKFKGKKHIGWPWIECIIWVLEDVWERGRSWQETGQ